MKKILIVEDSAEYQQKFSDALSEKFELLQAFTLPEGIALFEARSDELAAVAMDACVPGDSPNSMSVIRYIRDTGYTGPVIAISSLREYRMVLMAVGCDYECPKADFPLFLLKVLEKAGVDAPVLVPKRSSLRLPPKFLISIENFGGRNSPLDVLSKGRLLYAYHS